MLNLFRRHIATCPHRKQGRKHFRCSCPIWIDWRVGGQRIRKPLGLRDWQAAQRRAREMEAGGSAEAGKVATIQEACNKFLEDARGRNLRDATLYKYRLVFRQLQEFCQEHGLLFISDLDLDWVRRFRSTWTNRNQAAKRKLEYLRALFHFAVASGWIKENPASKLKAPETTPAPTIPFTREEVEKILNACSKYIDKENNATRLRALVLLLRYSGLRLGDAVTLSRERIKDGNLFLYTAKTGTPVSCPLPPVVLKALGSIAAKPYYFWTGASKTKSVKRGWQRALKKLFRLAGVPDGHAHRFRDTFAVELLLAGVPIEHVSILLGHRGVKITEQHYAPWVQARQEQLEADVKKAWAHAGHAAKLASVTVLK